MLRNEFNFSRCSYILGAEGELKPFDTEKQKEMTKNVIEPMASDGLRTIGIAYKDYKPRNEQTVENDVI